MLPSLIMSCIIGSCAASTTIPHVAFYFVRHGETDLSKERHYQGALDIPLNDAGRHAAAVTAATLTSHALTTLITSPLVRATETAAIIGRACKLNPIITDDIKERYGGAAEGKPIPKDFVFLEDKPAEFFAGAEPLATFSERILRGIQAALAQPGPVCIVAHGGVFRVLCHTLGIALEKNIMHASIVKLTPIDGTWQLESIDHTTTK